MDSELDYRQYLENPEEMLDPRSHNHLYHYILFTHVVTVVIGVIGNVVVIATWTGKARNRSPTAVFLVSLAVADLVFLLHAPLETLRYFVIAWPQIGSVCKLASYIEMLSGMASVLNLVAVSIERFLVIVFPMKARSFCTISKSRKGLLFVWILSLVLASPALYTMDTESATYYNNHTSVTAYYCFDKKEYELPLAIYQLMIMFVIPAVFMIICYSVVMKVLWSSTKTMESLAGSTGGHAPSQASVSALATTGPPTATGSTHLMNEKKGDSKSQTNTPTPTISRIGAPRSGAIVRWIPRRHKTQNQLLGNPTPGDDPHSGVEMNPRGRSSPSTTLGGGGSRGGGGGDTVTRKETSFASSSSSAKNLNKIQMKAPTITTKPVGCKMPLRVPDELFDPDEFRLDDDHDDELNALDHMEDDEGDDEEVDDEGDDGIRQHLVIQEASNAEVTRRLNHESRLTVPVTSGSRKLHKKLPIYHHQTKARKQVIKMLLLVMFLFLFCWGPKLIFKVIKNLNLISLNQTWYEIRVTCYLLSFIHSALNPFVYGLMSSTFRNIIFKSCTKRKRDRSPDGNTNTCTVTKVTRPTVPCSTRRPTAARSTTPFPVTQSSACGIPSTMDTVSISQLLPSGSRADSFSHEFIQGDGHKGSITIHVEGVDGEVENVPPKGRDVYLELESGSELEMDLLNERALHHRMDCDRNDSLGSKVNQLDVETLMEQEGDNL